MVCGDFGLISPKSTDHKETFTKNGFQNIATGSQIRASWIEIRLDFTYGTLENKNISLCFLYLCVKGWNLVHKYFQPLDFQENFQIT